MRSPYHGFTPPYQLPSNIVYFHDWRYVSYPTGGYGGYGWKGPHGEAVPMMGLGRVPPMHYEYRDIPLGIGLEALPASKSEPVLSASAKGDICLFGGSLIKEDGVYRLWYECWLKEDFGTERIGVFNALKYAESGDGIHWKRPHIHAKHGSPESRNIVYGTSLTPENGFHGGCVFKDISAPARERYKVFHLGKISAKALVDYCRRFPGDADPMVKVNTEHMHALYGAVSRDGFTWKAIHEPLLVQVSDTHNICEYDPVLKQYVAYIRTWLFNRRTIGRTVSSDFRHFSFPEEVFWPDAMQKPYDLWYANAKTVMPNAPDYHIMFPMRWNLTTDRFDFHLAASPDNVVWGFIPGGPVCMPGQGNSWDAGTVGPGLGMVELPGNRIGILYSGTPIPHKYPRRPPLGKLAWAYWQKGRLVALKSPLEGSFLTWPLKFQGRKAQLNYRTTMTGYIQVEAVCDGKVLPGRSFADCDSIAGDELNRAITWRGAADIGHSAGAAVSFRFRLRNAELFSLCFK